MNISFYNDYIFIYIYIYIVKTAYLSHWIQHNAIIIMMIITTRIVMIIIIMAFFIYVYLILLFLRFNANASITYSFIKKWSVSKISRIWFNILKLKIRRPIYSDSSVNVWGISILTFLLWLPSRSYRFHGPTLWIFCLFVLFFLFFIDGYVTTNQLYHNCLFEMSVDDILSQIFNIYTYIYIYIYMYI